MHIRMSALYISVNLIYDFRILQNAKRIVYITTAFAYQGIIVH